MRNVCSAAIKVVKMRWELRSNIIAWDQDTAAGRFLWRRHHWLIRVRVTVPQGILQCRQLWRGTNSHRLWDLGTVGPILSLSKKKKKKKPTPHRGMLESSTKGGRGCFLSQQHSLALIELWEKEFHKHQDMM